MGGDEADLEIHLTEFPHRCCTCLPGMASVSGYGVKNPVITCIEKEKKNRFDINLSSRNNGNTMLSVLSKMQRATFMPGEHRT